MSEKDSVERAATYITEHKWQISAGAATAAGLASLIFGIVHERSKSQQDELPEPEESPSTPDTP